MMMDDWMAMRKAIKDSNTTIGAVFEFKDMWRAGCLVIWDEKPV